MRICFFLLLVLLVARACDRFSGTDLRVTFFDVGQGDSALIRFPQGHAWLIDAGGGWKDWDRGQRELFLELARMGILTLDAAIISHPDMDHALGFRGLFGQIRIEELWFSRAAPPVPLLVLLQRLARAHGTPTRIIEKEKIWRMGGVEARVWSLPSAKSKNESPLVVQLEYAGCSFLFAGDAEKRAERLIAAKVNPTTVLKVNHHGSRTSSTEVFVAAVRPHWAVASVGAQNRYRHPAAEVARDFWRRGSRWLRTDIHGFVEFKVTSKGEISCRSAAGDCGVASCI